MRRLFNLITLGIALILGTALCVGYLSSYVSPHSLGYLSLLWFAVPYLAVANAGMALWLMIIHRWKTMLVSVAALVITAGAVPRLVSIGKRDTASHSDTLRVLTFNTHFMDMADDKSEYARFFEEQNADIVCLQEPPSRHQLRKYGISDLKAFAGGYPYMIERNYYGGPGQHSPAFVVMSKYPLSEKAVTDTAGQRLPYVVAAEVRKGDRRMMVYNVHLESIRLQQDQIGAVGQAVKHPIDAKADPKLKSTGSQIVRAFGNRAEQAEKLRAALDREELPTVVCGDFNDTPISYTYNQMTARMSDSFCEGHGGFGRTYNGKLPPLRIDYVLHTPHFVTIRYREHRVDLSDHFPVTATLAIEGD